MAIDSKPGAGTTVRATVPLAPDGPDALDPVAQGYNKDHRTVVWGLGIGALAGFIADKVGDGTYRRAPIVEAARRPLWRAFRLP